MLCNHQVNMPMQYTYFSEIEISELNFCDIFLDFVQNIDCGCTLELPNQEKKIKVPIIHCTCVQCVCF